jgi:hypothetical protein
MSTRPAMRPLVATTRSLSKRSRVLTHRTGFTLRAASSTTFPRRAAASPATAKAAAAPPMPKAEAPTPSSSLPPMPTPGPPSGGYGGVDWLNSYHGIGARPFSKEVSDILMEPVNIEDVEVKPDGIVYLPEIKYRRILNRAFGPGGWGLVPRSEVVVGDKIVTREYALICDGRYV